MSDIKSDLTAVQNLAKFVKAGGRVALGTDFMGYDKPFQLGMPMIEIELMMQAGMTPMEGYNRIYPECCPKSATWKYELGTLEPGKIADILVVGSDPASRHPFS